MKVVHFSEVGIVNLTWQASECDGHVGGKVLEKMRAIMYAEGAIGLPEDYTNRVLTDMLLEMVKVWLIIGIEKDADALCFALTL